MKKYIKKISKELTLYIIVTLITYFIYSLIPYYTKILFEGEYKKSIIGYTLCLVAFVFFAYLGNVIQKKWQIKFEKELKKDYFNKVINLDYEEFSKKKVGEYISFQANDIKLIRDDYLNPLVGIIGQVLRILTNFVVIAITLNIKVSIFLITLSFLGVILPKSLGKETAKKRDNYLNKQKKYYSIIEEFFNGFKVINYRTRQNINKKHDESLEEVAKEEYNYGKSNSLMWALNGLGSESLNYITFLYLGYMTFKGNIGIGFAIATFQYAQSLMEPVHEILYYIGLVNSTTKMRESFFNFLDTDSHTVEGKKKHINSFEKIQVKNLSKKFSNFDLVDININLEKNKKYALIGLNGSGKSTLFNILSSYITDYDGEIKIDGTNIKEIETSYLIGTMNQNEYIFRDNFEENITVFNSYKNLKDNIFINDAKEFQDREDSTNLSGGQKKVLGLCRLINANTPILFLDEPFSAIDQNKKEDLFNKIITLEKTIVMITHDLGDNLNKFDSILFMENGRIIYNLPYSELKNKSEFLNFKNKVMI